MCVKWNSCGQSLCVEEVLTGAADGSPGDHRLHEDSTRRACST